MEPQVRQFSPEDKPPNNSHNKPNNNVGATTEAAGELALAREPTPRAGLERIPTYLQPSISLRERLRHFTFAWYTVTMSTGGIALVLVLTPHRFRGLDTIGLVVFLFDLACFVAISACLALRFALYQHTFRKTLTRPREALFVPTFFLSVAALLSNAQKYGALFLPDTAAAQDGLAVFLRVTFWAYLSATFAVSVLQYHLLFTVKEQRRLTVHAMTPAWILPIFPVMLAGTVAAFDSPTQRPDRALPMLCAGLAAQGLGFLVSIFLYATYVSRLMVYGLPAHRPAMFIAVGPPSFTCAALVGMANDAPRVFAEAAVFAGSGGGGDGGKLADNAAVLADGVRLLALCGSVFLWGLSFWFFASAVAAVAAGLPDRRFHLSWWSFVFPNVGFCVSTIRVGETTGSAGLLWFGTVLTAALVVVWLFVFWRCVWAVVRREIVWPGHDEDSD